MFDGDLVVSWNAACGNFSMVIMMMKTMMVVAVKISYKYSDYDGVSCENYGDRHSGRCSMLIIMTIADDDSS